jgi:hypothetical protein
MNQQTQTIRHRSKSPSPVSLALNPYAKLDADSKQAKHIKERRAALVAKLSSALGPDCAVKYICELVQSDGTGAPLYVDRFRITSQQSGGFRPSQLATIDSWPSADASIKRSTSTTSTMFVAVPQRAYGAANQTRWSNLLSNLLRCAIFLCSLWLLYASAANLRRAEPLLRSLLGAVFEVERS